MKFKIYVSLFATIICTQTIIPAKNWNLNKYIQKAKTEGIKQSPSVCDDAIMAAMLATAGLGVAHLAAPAYITLKSIAGAAIAAEFILGYDLYKHYTATAPIGFARDLKRLNNLIDNYKTVFIGGKEYMLDAHFNNLENTGYIRSNPTLSAACSAENQMTHQLISKKQYEIYLMPNHNYLVNTFEDVIKALTDSAEAQNIAFIAIRPTPIPYNNAKQILPRIVIVLKENSPKEAVENIIKTAYQRLKNDLYTYLKPSGYQPRYSEEVAIHDNAWTPISEKLKDIFFVGIGNTDFKTLHHEQFERKKFLGLTRHGDMAYPIDTPEADKISTVTVGK